MHGSLILTSALLAFNGLVAAASSGAVTVTVASLNDQAPTANEPSVWLTHVR